MGCMTKQATLHRMVMPGHTCPYGLKAKHLLESRGFAVDDRWLTTREATDAFKAEHGVKTTPQTFIDGVRIGQIRLPEICSNVCFGGTRRNRLFMTGSQSLYAVYVETQGAHIS